MSKNINQKKQASNDFPALPGSKEWDEETLKLFREKKERRGASYIPRTRHHLEPKGTWARYTNLLFLEESPYLLQHAHNPVQWHPWCPAAFEKAQELDLPVLLSVGYSTCHWCHVMEEESFEDKEIAEYLNHNYVCIKVDREERPDVDSLYMNAVQILTGRGGWPMTVWLSPQARPFFAGTYFPPRDHERGFSLGFLTLLKKLKEIYNAQKDMVERTSDQLFQVLKQGLQPRPAESEGSWKDGGQNIRRKLLNDVQESFDVQWWGAKGAPKFPQSFPFRYLMRHYWRGGDLGIWDKLETTLRQMTCGGLYDQIGGGFHRYSTDEKWMVPHFEKMLYDQAQLVTIFTEAYWLKGKKEHERIVRETLHFVESEMRSPQGGFYTALDADSMNQQGEREEGLYFTWKQSELQEILSDAEYEVARKYLGIEGNGNFEDRQLPYLPLGYPQEEPVQGIFAGLRTKLLVKRRERTAPLRDEKILTNWNGLMIGAYALSGLILGEISYIQRAEECAHFLIKRIMAGSSEHGHKKIFHSWKDGQLKGQGLLEDYAFFISGLLALFEAKGDMHWLQLAIDLSETVEELFEDKDNGGFFSTPKDGEILLVREKNAVDNAVPSGNSVHVLNLLLLHAWTSKEKYFVSAQRTLNVFENLIEEHPLAYGEMLVSLDFFWEGLKEIHLVGENEDDLTPFLQEIRKVFLPNRALLKFLSERGAGINGERIPSPLEWTKLIPSLKGKLEFVQEHGYRSERKSGMAFVCERGLCHRPTHSPKEFAKQLTEE